MDPLLPALPPPSVLFPSVCMCVRVWSRVHVHNCVRVRKTKCHRCTQSAWAALSQPTMMYCTVETAKSLLITHSHTQTYT